MPLRQQSGRSRRLKASGRLCPAAGSCPPRKSRGNNPGDRCSWPARFFHCLWSGKDVSGDDPPAGCAPAPARSLGDQMLKASGTLAPEAFAPGKDGRDRRLPSPICWFHDLPNKSERSPLSARERLERLSWVLKGLVSDAFSEQTNPPFAVSLGEATSTNAGPDNNRASGKPVPVSRIG